MEIIITIASILGISSIAWFVRKTTPLKVCPICAGVAGTWIWMLIGILTNQLSVVSYQLLVATLMGGSVVGIAYQLEKKLPLNRSSVLWKMVFIPAGFIAVYALLSAFWVVLVAGLIFICAISWFFLFASHPYGAESKKVSDLEREMEKCC